MFKFNYFILPLIVGMKKLSGTLQIAIAAVLIYWFLFHGLGRLPFRVWDETRLINSAYELTNNHHFLVPTVDNHPDMWNCKPPLMIWVQVLFIKLFGFSEWSVRLPAALCGMLTIMAVVCFISRLIKDKWLWLTPLIVLCTSGGLIGSHTARFGEYDAMLTLFTTCYLMSFFLYTETAGSARNKYLLLFFICLSLAGLTKGIAAMLFTPALLLYLLLRNQLFETIANKYFYTGLLIFFFIVPGYYLLREHYNPGYLQAVWDNELAGRYNTTLGGNRTPWTYYWYHFRFIQFSTWYWTLPVSLLLLWFAPAKIFRAALFSWLCAIVFLTVISRSETKMPWYDLPVFPLFAILATIVIFQIAGAISQVHFMSREAATIALLVIFSAQPIYESVRYLARQHDNLKEDNFYAASYYFRDALNGKRDVNDKIYLSSGYNIQWRLYVKWLNEKGVRLEDHPYLNDVNVLADTARRQPEFRSGNRVIANQDLTKNYIENNYTYRIEDEYFGLKEYLIISPK
jgi:4-amino-4-deoxy-L-arabinose transferase-like glycosyltransferase